MSDMNKREALDEHEVVIHVPQGTKHNVRVEEAADMPNEITVQVSKKRKPTARPVLGVIVK